MEKNQPPIAQKSNSFSSSSSSNTSEKLCQRNLSLNAINFEQTRNQDDYATREKPSVIEEGEEGNDDSNEPQEELVVQPDTLLSLVDAIDQFLAVLHGLRRERGGGGPKAEGESDNDNAGDGQDELPDIPESVIEKFVSLLETEIGKYENGDEKLSPEPREDELSLLDVVDRISKLTEALSPLAANPSYFESMNMTSIVLHHAMSFLEEEFFSLLEESWKSNKDQAGNNGKTKQPPSFSRSFQDQERAVSSPQEAEANPVDYFPWAESVAILRVIANAMISAGYDTECRQVFATSRRNAYKASMSDLGFEKMTIDDVQRMGWDALDCEIGKWLKSFRHSITTSLLAERDLCFAVFADHLPVAAEIFYHLASNTTHNLLNFPEAVAMTKRSTEKLFKVLDMYEASRDMIPMVDLLFPKENNDEKKPTEEEDDNSLSLSLSSSSSFSSSADIKAEIFEVQCRLGEAAFAIFCGELDYSIKSDAGKNAVPGGAVHPLTRYVMNYLKYACEYIATLEQIFNDHKKSEEGCDQDRHSSNNGISNSNSNSTSSNSNTADSRSSNTSDSISSCYHTPFETQLTQVMDLLQANLESKAKLYKEQALRSIFLMNNGRYIVQKIKGSPEINKLLGNTWCRKRSSELRQYHKNYQRETWSKVLACFKDEGLTVKGSVNKLVLKERFKSFNAQFDEIHRVQSMWIVSDEQLQSELRVSISAVVVPAYRSFLGRFQQHFTAGRQLEKYVKFTPEELEGLVDELFDGNQSAMLRRRT